MKVTTEERCEKCVFTHTPTVIPPAAKARHVLNQIILSLQFNFFIFYQLHDHLTNLPNNSSDQQVLLNY